MNSVLWVAALVWQVHGLKRLRFYSAEMFLCFMKKRIKKKNKQYSSSISSVFHAHITSPSVWLYFCLLCFLAESCKDILAATGNYAQPEVTTLTWRWLAVKRRESMSWLRSTRCAELQLRSLLCFLFLNELQADSFFLQGNIFVLLFISVTHPPKTLWYKISCIADVSYLLSFYVLQTFCMCCMI